MLYHTSTNSKHLNTCLAMSQNTHTAETVSGAPCPVWLPRRKTNVMANGHADSYSGFSAMKTLGDGSIFALLGSIQKLAADELRAKEV